MDRYEWVYRDEKYVASAQARDSHLSEGNIDVAAYTNELLRLAALVEEQRAENERLKDSEAWRRDQLQRQSLVDMADRIDELKTRAETAERENERLERERLEDLRSLSMAMGNPALNWTPPQTIDGALMSFACRRLEEATETVNALSTAERALADAEEAIRECVGIESGGGLDPTGGYYVRLGRGQSAVPVSDKNTPAVARALARRGAAEVTPPADRP